MRLNKLTKLMVFAATMLNAEPQTRVTFSIVDRFGSERPCKVVESSSRDGEPGLADRFKNCRAPDIPERIYFYRLEPEARGMLWVSGSEILRIETSDASSPKATIVLERSLVGVTGQITLGEGVDSGTGLRLRIVGQKSNVIADASVSSTGAFNLGRVTSGKYGAILFSNDRVVSAHAIVIPQTWEYFLRIPAKQ